MCADEKIVAFGELARTNGDCPKDGNGTRGKVDTWPTESPLGAWPEEAGVASWEGIKDSSMSVSSVCGVC